ncbi:unnamed protein product [Pedinophyceae sp. YPF-701]|nr:unnamed protein product [Pedinophyceae sp. YPF-701]
MENVPLAQRLKGLIPGVEELAARCQEPQAKHEGLWCNNSSGVMTIARREEANVPGGLYHVWRNSARVVKTTVGSWASTASDGRKAAYLFVDVLKRDLSMLRHPALAAVGSSTAPGGDVDASSSSKSSGSVAGSFDLVSPTGVLDEAASLEILDAMRDCEVFVELLGDSGWRGVERVSLQCVPSSLLLTPCLVETDIFVVQVVGRMRATLVPPAHVLDLYLYPLRHPYHGSSMVDWRHPDFFQWPRSQHVRGMSTVLEPGRTLFVPRSWYVCYETFAADSPSVAVHIRPRGAAARHTGAMQDQPELGAPVKDSRVAELLHRVERWATAQASHERSAREFTQVGVSKAAEILPQLASEYSRPQRSSPPLTPSASDSASNLSADHHEQLFDCLTWALDEAGWDRTLPDIAVDIATKQLASGNWTGSPYRGGGSDARRER